jgi:hypothetical protein
MNDYPYLVTPSRPLSPEKQLYFAGIYHNHIPVPEALLARFYGRIEYQNKYEEPQQYIDTPSVYCGRFFNHYGHFLLESLSRLTNIRKFPNLLCVYVQHTEDDLCHWQKEIFQLLGIKNKFILIDKPTGFRKLLVPKPGYIIQTEFTDEHNKFLSTIEASSVCLGKKIFLSRKNIGKKIYSNEDVVEQILLRNGWNIIYPETMSVAEQLHEISSSEIVLGIEGSAFHSIILLKNLHTKIFAIKREKNDNYITIRNKKKFNYNRVDLNDTSCQNYSIDLHKLLYSIKKNDIDFSEFIVADNPDCTLLCKSNLQKTLSLPIWEPSIKIGHNSGLFGF